jgi:hypothetical protein
VVAIGAFGALDLIIAVEASSAIPRSGDSGFTRAAIALLSGVRDRRFGCRERR